MTDKILVVEDEINLQETLAYNLKLEGYQVKVAGDGRKGLDEARNWRPDLILLDVMLPEINGFEMLKILRREMDIPILILTARADEVDRVVGFEIGADDYILKPFSMRELMARVETRLRLYHKLKSGKQDAGLFPKEGEEEIIFGNLVVDSRRHEVRLDDRVIPLKPKEFDLLKYLAENHGRALTREMILEKVWGWSYIGNDRTVDVHIRWLRSKIEPDPKNPTRILTVPGVGYRFEG